jgi:hypothetical protein
MNQKVIIYIILSAILLYLYYKRGNLAIFAAFVVVVAGTLIFRGDNDELEGFGMGGGGGGKGDKECAKMGFTETQMDKKNLIGSLKKINDNFKKALLKYVKLDDDGAPEPKKETIELLKPIAEDSELKAIIEKEQKENKDLFSYAVIVFILFMNTYNKSDSGEMTFKVFGKEKPVQEILDDWAKEKDGKNGYDYAVSSGESILKTLNKVKSLDVIKNADKKTKEVCNFGICAVKHTVGLIKNLSKIARGGDDGGGDDEEEKPKKKTKKTKKASEDNEDANADEDEEEKPKKKTTKKKSKKADDDEEE